MSSKKFTPSLLGIPEEDYSLDFVYDYSKATGSRRSSLISLKRENSRRKICNGCFGCEPQDFKALCGKLPEFPSLAACENCTSTSESKQKSIQRWLEDVPILKETKNDISDDSSKSPRSIRSPARSLILEQAPRAISPRPASENLSSKPKLWEPPRKSAKTKAPLPPSPKKEPEIHHYDTISEEIPKNLPPPDMIHEAMAVDSKGEPKIPTLTKRRMNAVINEFANQISAEVPASSPVGTVDYETDSLERSGANKGYYTPTDYGDVSSSQPSPSLSAALPLEEELTMRNAIINTKTGAMTISKLNLDSLAGDEEYELIVVKTNDYDLPELLQKSNGYSLVSEVYVNNGYNYGSAPSSPTDSNSSTMERLPNIQQSEENPGHLLIEVEDCLDNYIKIEDSDSFEPDTLDRKPSKKKEDDDFCDSLERPNQILLQTTGSFKSPIVQNITSLREIYETKRTKPEEGRILTLEKKHSKRQRNSIKEGNIPDVIPPPPHPIYEHPKPPRKVETENKLKNPPFHQQTHQIYHASNLIQFKTPLEALNVKRTWKKLILSKPEDSGYLSTDSNESRKKQNEKEAGSETDESLGDGHSESGAESVETHSVFFGSYRKDSCVSASVDSGVGPDVQMKEHNPGLVLEETVSSDSETMSYKTVVPLRS